MGGHKPLKEHHDDDDEKQQLQHSQTENYSITIWLIILSILIMIGITITGFVLIFIITNSNNINSNSYIDNDIIGTTGNNRILIDPVTGEFDTESMGKTQSSQLQTPLLVIHFTPKSESKSSDEPQPQQQSQHQAEAKRSKRSVTSGYIDGSSSSNPHLTHQSGTIQEARLEPIPATVSTVNFNSHPVTYKPECTRQAITMCSGYLNHNYTVYPNYLGHNNLMEASRSLGKFNSIIKSKCNNRIKQLLCTLLEPPCIDGRSLPPCRRFCRIAVDSCGDHVPTNSDYAGAFDCRRYPDSIDHNVCVDPSAGKKCSSDEFQCLDSSCIPRQWTCDGVQDCLNAADEKNCAGQGHKAKVSLQSIGSGNNMDGVVRKKKLSLNDRRFSSRSDLGLAASQIQSNLYSSKLGFNLPGYNVNNIRTHSLTGPTASNDYFTHREMSLTGSPDYSANGAGFVLPDMQSEATSNRLYDLALAGSMENERKALLESSAHRTQSELSGMESSPSMGDSQISSSSPTESALTRYLKAAAAAEASGSSQSAVSSDENPTSGLVSGSSSMVRRKPLYADRVVEEQHIFDPAVAKHLLKQRESELAANALLESGLTDTTSASESELMSQQLAAMSDFGSSHSSTGSQSLGNSEFLPFSASSPSFSLTPAAMSSLVDSHSFSSSSPLRALSASASLGSLSSLNGHSLMSAASSLPSLISPYALSSLPRGPTGASGVPAGAIVGAPGSQPPPGMKLAGYVTMTNPSPPMMNPSMSASMMNPVGMMGQNPQAQAMAQLMAQSMAQGVKFPFPAFSPTGTTGTGQLGGMMGGQMMNSSPVASASSSSSTSSTSNASPSSSNTATRTRLLSRLNPLNLFRRFRMRNQNSGSSGSTSTPSESNAEAEKRSTVVKEHFKSGHYNHHSSSNRYLLHNNQHPHHQHQQQQQHHHNHLNYHPSSNYQSPLNGVTQYQSSPSSSISSSSSSSSPSTSSQFYYPQIGSHQNQLGIGSTFHSSSLPLHRQYMSIKRSDLQPEYRLAHLKRSRRETRREVHEDVDDDMKKINDTETAENYYPFAGYTIPLMERIHFRPNRRGSRRLATVGPDQYFSTESQDNIGLMGSGNFEVIRGGILPASSNTRSTATRLAHPKSGSRYQKDEVERNYPASRGRGNKGDERDDDEDEDDSGDDKGMFAPLEDDFFGSDSPGVLGFQGFNHFSGSSIYNVLSASKQKSNVLNDGHTKKSSSSSLMSKNNGLLAAASSPPTLSTEIDALPPSILTSDITSSSSSSPSS